MAHFVLFQGHWQQIHQVAAINKSTWWYIIIHIFSTANHVSLSLWMYFLTKQHEQRKKFYKKLHLIKPNRNVNTVGILCHD